MAYDLIGIAPSEPFGKAFRCNVFLWHDILIILYCCEVIDRDLARSMMFSDGMAIDANECARISDDIKTFVLHNSIVDICLDSYMDFRPYRQEPEIVNARKSMVEKLKLLVMFLDRCGGFIIT